MSDAATIRLMAQDAGARGFAPHATPPPIGEALLDTPVLIIEDEAMIAWTLESLFDGMGFTHIALAPSAEGAIAAAREASPGLIVSDINLGGGPDGVDAVAAITADAPVPTIFVTGYAGDETRARIATLIPGATLLRKPVQLEDLQCAVAAALEPTAH